MFGFLAFVVILLLRVSLSKRPLLNDIMADSSKFGLAMVVAVLSTTSSLGFLSDLELLGGIVL